MDRVWHACSDQAACTSNRFISHCSSKYKRTLKTLTLFLIQLWKMFHLVCHLLPLFEMKSDVCTYICAGSEIFLSLVKNGKCLNSKHFYISGEHAKENNWLKPILYHYLLNWVTIYKLFWKYWYKNNVFDLILCRFSTNINYLWTCLPSQSCRNSSEILIGFYWNISGTFC